MQHDDPPPEPAEIARLAASAIAEMRAIASRLAEDPRNARLATEICYAIDWAGALARKAQACADAQRARAAADQAAAAALAGFSARREEPAVRAAAAAGGTGPLPAVHAVRHGRPVLRVIRGGLAAAAALAVVRALQAHWKAAGGAVVTASLAVPLTVAAIHAQPAPYESRVRPASAVTVPVPAVAAAPSSAAVHHRARRHRLTVTAPPPPAHRKAPRRVPSPSAVPQAGVAVPASLVLHAGADGVAVLTLTAEGGRACWTATATAPLVLHEAPGPHCLADGDSAGIPVTAPAGGTITVVSGGQVITVTVITARSYGTMPAPASA